MHDLLGESATMHEIDGGALDLKLEGYGYRWLRLRSPGQRTAP